MRPGNTLSSCMILAIRCFPCITKSMNSSNSTVPFWFTSAAQKSFLAKGILELTITVRMHAKRLHLDLRHPSSGDPKPESDLPLFCRAAIQGLKHLLHLFELEGAIFVLVQLLELLPGHTSGSPAAPEALHFRHLVVAGQRLLCLQDPSEAGPLLRRLGLAA